MASTGEWTPDQTAATLALDSNQLRRLAALSAQDKLEALATLLDRDEQQALSRSMQAGREPWYKAASPLADGELVDLIKTLAMAEMRLPNCACGAKSPVIHINRLLKQRGQALGTADLLWLKQHSTNRFIPNGPIL